jgi:hypothetical protein
MEIRQLRTAAEIGALVRVRDEVGSDPLMLCDYGQFIQWLQKAIPENKGSMAAFAAFNAQGHPLGYIVIVTCVAPPVYRFGSVLRFCSHDPEATPQLAAAAREWGREHGIKQVVVSTYDERAKRFYERQFRLREAGWQLHGEV